MSDSEVAYEWHPLDWPTNAELEYKSAQTRRLADLRQAWLGQRDRLEAERPGNYRDFLTRLVRSWAIETGILERIYDLDDGATETLIEEGFRADLIERAQTTMRPEELMVVLTDHQDAARMVMELVRDERPLTKHFVRELHQLLTRTQTHTEGRTEDGTPVEIPLEHGGFKRLPNNPTRPDGSLHEYAPPEHVEAEMDCLIEGYGLMEGTDPAVTAAWLHHRFTQIHPFQDGNGRVARALTNYVFIKAGLFPLVINRRDRPQYIAALERADEGVLGPLVDMFAEVQSATVIRALSVAEDEVTNQRGSTVDAVIERIKAKAGVRIRDRESALRGVNDVALELRGHGREHVLVLANRAEVELREAGLRLRVWSDSGGLDAQTEHWWKRQLLDIANEHDYWINFQEGQYWFRVGLGNGPIRMQYVVSLHHVGHDLTGVMQIVAFAEYEIADDLAALQTAQEGLKPSERIRHACVPTMFTVTWQSNVDAVRAPLEEWLDESFAMALRRWHDLF